MSTEIQIVNGPSKFELMTALFTRKPNKPEVYFRQKHTTTELIASILSVADEDGSGDSWYITGFLHDIYVVGGTNHGGVARKVSRQHFSGRFSTADRKGYLQFDD